MSESDQNVAIGSWEQLPESSHNLLPVLPTDGEKDGAFVGLVLLLAPQIFLELPTWSRQGASGDFVFLLLLFAIFGGSIFVVVLQVHRRSRRRAQLRVNEELALSAPDRFVLYLRSFRSSGYTMVRNYHPQWTVRHLTGVMWDIELALSWSMVPKLPVVAVGHTPGSLGAAKLTTTDDRWQSAVLELMERAQAIVVVPDARDGTLWELEAILDTPRFSDKCIVVMPPRQKGWRRKLGGEQSTDSMWCEVKARLGTRIAVPEYNEVGALLRHNVCEHRLEEFAVGDFSPENLRAAVVGCISRTAGFASPVRNATESLKESFLGSLSPIWLSVFSGIFAVAAWANRGGDLDPWLIAIPAASLILFGMEAGRYGVVRSSKWYRRFVFYSGAPRVLREHINVGIVAAVILVIRSWIAEPFAISGASMVPTLQIGDFVWVDKNAYGLRMPLTNTKFMDLGRPARGDVIVFRFPPDETQTYVKRVVGLPGDEIRVDNGVLYVNGARVVQQPIGRFTGEGSNAEATGSELLNESLGINKHRILAIGARRSRDNETWLVPEGHYFVLGDHRDNSEDSRRWGTVPEENLVGRVFFVWWHWDWKLRGYVQWTRVGTTVH